VNLQIGALTKDAASMTKIIIFGNHPAGPTGFGKVVARLADAARAADLTPVIVALGKTYDSLDARIVSPGEGDPIETLEGLVKDEKITTVLSIGDPWDVQGLVEVKARTPFTWIGYTPVDGVPYPRFLLLTKDPHQYLDAAYIHAHMDCCVTYSEFGQRAVTSMLEQALPNPGPEVECIPLGVDTDLFAPKPKAESRKVLQGQVTEDTLLFTCMKVNSIRAGFDTLLESWGAYLAKARRADPSLAERSRLYLHTLVNGGAYLLPALMRRYDLGHSILLNPGLEPGECLPEATIADIHNASDVAVSAARSEGFGLPIIEALSCKVPCIVPDYGGPAEYGGDAVLRVPIAATFNPEFAATDFAIVDRDAFAESMLALALDAEKRSRMGSQGREIALTLTWDVFTKRWAELLREVTAAS